MSEKCSLSQVMCLLIPKQLMRSLACTRWCLPPAHVWLRLLIGGSCRWFSLSNIPFRSVRHPIAAVSPLSLVDTKTYTSSPMWWSLTVVNIFNAFYIMQTGSHVFNIRGEVNTVEAFVEALVKWVRVFAKWTRSAQTYGVYRCTNSKVRHAREYPCGALPTSVSTRFISHRNTSSVCFLELSTPA